MHSVLDSPSDLSDMDVNLTPDSIKEDVKSVVFYLNPPSAKKVRPISIKNTCPATPKDKRIKIDAGDKTKQKSSCACEVHMPVPCHQCHLACKNIDNNRKQVIQNFQECQRSPCSYMSSANGAAQTSDYAINLGNLACGLPLLVRIVSPRQ